MSHIPYYIKTNCKKTDLKDPTGIYKELRDKIRIYKKCISCDGAGYYGFLGYGGFGFCNLCVGTGEIEIF